MTPLRRIRTRNVDRYVDTKTLLRDKSNQKSNHHIEKLMNLKDAMMEITHAIMDNISESELFHLILDKSLAAIKNADHGTVLMKGENDLFKPVAWRGYADSEIENFELELEKSFVRRATVGELDKSVRINDLSKFIIGDIPNVAESSTGLYINSSLCSPIIVEGEIIGLLNMDSTLLDAFDDSDLALSEYMREQLEIALTRRNLYDRVVYLSRHDELTGLYNRRYFEELAKSTLKRSARYKEKFCLAVFDLNGLKSFNDNFGHQVGDAIIKGFSETLKESFRETDILGRYGGDEFVGVFIEGDIKLLNERLETILEKFKASPIIHQGHEYHGSFSYGIATYPDDGDTYSRLVSEADHAMYRYKNARIE